LTNGARSRPCLHGHDRASEEPKGLIPRGLPRKPPGGGCRACPAVLIPFITSRISTSIPALSGPQYLPYQYLNSCPIRTSIQGCIRTPIQAVSGPQYRAVSGPQYRAVSGPQYRALYQDPNTGSIRTPIQAISGPPYRAVSGPLYRQYQDLNTSAIRPSIPPLSGPQYRL
jgi:hypothetical protein